jgi:hypothetical protein
MISRLTTRRMGFTSRIEHNLDARRNERDFPHADADSIEDGIRDGAGDEGA